MSLNQSKEELKRELQKITGVIKEALKLWKPKPKLLVSEWADRNRILSPDASAEPGKWYTDRTPYLRDIMDAFVDPDVEMVVVMTSSQVGKTECILNVIGYYIDYEPAPILVIQPTLEIAKSFSKERLTPMLRDSPCFKGKILKTKMKNPDETVLHKKFPGGFIAIAGANSPASFSARPIRILLCDEVDRYPISVGVEGDPIELARKRTTTFWNRKIGLFSTPTLKGVSRIELAYEMSDKRKYYVPCPYCGFEQVLLFENLKWEDDKPHTAFYECAGCGRHLNDADKLKMIARGRWIKEREVPHIAGFWLNELYSPWVSFATVATRYLEAQKSRETLKVFINTSLGLPYEEEESEQLSNIELIKRVENYEKVPDKVAVLTSAVDVHEDRLEILVVGWGKGEEAWHIEHKVIYGYTVTEQPWTELDEYLQKTFETESGEKLKITICLIDSGFITKKVYDFVKPRQSRRIYAAKGANISGAPLVGRPKLVGHRKVKLFQVGVTTAKDIIFGRLKLEKEGPGYIHFNRQCDEEYFLQLLSEKPVYRTSKGQLIKEYIKVRPRNEILDLWVYNLAAITILSPNFEKILENRAASQTQQPQPLPQIPPSPLKPLKPKRRSWVRDWDVF